MRAKVRNLFVVFVSVVGVFGAVASVSAHVAPHAPMRFGDSPSSAGILKYPFPKLPGVLPTYEVSSLATSPTWQSRSEETISLALKSLSPVVQFSKTPSLDYAWPRFVTFDLTLMGGRTTAMTGTLTAPNPLGGLTEDYQVRVPSTSKTELAVLTVEGPITVDKVTMNGLIPNIVSFSVQTTGANAAVTLSPAHQLQNKTPKLGAGELPEIPLAGAFPALLSLVGAGTWVMKRKKPGHRHPL